MADLNASGPNPGTTYTPSETNGVYHEDREVTVSSTVGSQMFRAYNATFDENLGEWKIPTSGSGKPAYATVQNPDGSIHFVTKAANSSPWNTWDGSGNNTVFNGIDFGMVANSPSTDNTAALQLAITAVMHAGGGTIFIPAGTYYFTSSTGITIAPTQSLPAVGLIIAGTSGLTKLVQSSGAALALFTVNSWVDPGSIGVGLRFQDLIILFTGAASGAQAINVASSQMVTATRVLFADCPQTMYMDGRSLQCGLFQCMITYDQGPSTQTMIFMGGSENYVESCVISQTAKGTIPAPPGGCTAINIQPGGGGMYVTNTQISDFDYGITITGGGNNLDHAFISNVHCECNITAVLIQPIDSNEKVYQVFFNSCDFALTTLGTQATPGVLISLANGGMIADIFFTNCMSHNWAGPGLQINGGQNISVIGGRFAANATDPSMTTSGGIAVTGPAQYVTIIGADCYGQIPKYGSEPTPNPVQPYGISVTGAVVAMRVRGCNLNGNASGALYAPTSGMDLQVSDCAGYNDQHPILNGNNAPTLGNPLSASTCSTPYYGPSVVTFSGSSPTPPLLSVLVSGLSTFSMSFGDFYLSRPTDQVGFGASPAVFAWIGK
ncbi:MAG TPA: hypothetical protein VMT95_01215 [Candidatus Binatia bacterium]|nr:hypothetical protein [Candidatus Binatia bacterium]